MWAGTKAAEPGPPQPVVCQAVVLASALGKGASRSWLAMQGDSGGS